MAWPAVSSSRGQTVSSDGAWRLGTTVPMRMGPRMVCKGLGQEEEETEYDGGSGRREMLAGKRRYVGRWPPPRPLSGACASALALSVLD